MILLRIDRPAEVSLAGLGAGTHPAPCLQRHRTHDLDTLKLTDNLAQATLHFLCLFFAQKIQSVFDGKIKSSLD